MNITTKITEHNEVIAVRVPPGDRWTLVNDQKKFIYSSITDTLEAYFNETKFKGSYRLSPLDNKLYAIKSVTEEILPEPIREYNIYGDPV